MSNVGPPQPKLSHFLNGFTVYTVLVLSSRLGDMILPELLISNATVNQMRSWIFWMTIVVHLLEAVYFDIARLHRAGLRRGGALWTQWMTSQICIGMPAFGLFEQALREKSFGMEQKLRRVRYKGWRVIDF